eukprot:5422607-Pleurochrysis_carterae.AAC.1
MSTLAATRVAELLERNVLTRTFADVPDARSSNPSFRNWSSCTAICQQAGHAFRLHACQGACQLIDGLVQVERAMSMREAAHLECKPQPRTSTTASHLRTEQLMQHQQSRVGLDGPTPRCLQLDELAAVEVRDEASDRHGQSGGFPLTSCPAPMLISHVLLDAAQP